MSFTEFKDAFKLFDPHGEGTISCEKLGDAMRNLGMNPTEEQLQKMIEKADKDGECL